MLARPDGCAGCPSHGLRVFAFARCLTSFTRPFPCWRGRTRRRWRSSPKTWWGWLTASAPPWCTPPSGVSPGGLSVEAIRRRGSGGAVPAASEVTCRNRAHAPPASRCCLGFAQLQQNTPLFDFPYFPNMLNLCLMCVYLCEHYPFSRKLDGASCGSDGIDVVRCDRVAGSGSLHRRGGPRVVVYFLWDWFAWANHAAIRRWWCCTSAAVSEGESRRRFSSCYPLRVPAGLWSYRRSAQRSDARVGRSSIARSMTRFLSSRGALALEQAWVPSPVSCYRCD